MKRERYRAKVRLHHDQLGRIEPGQEIQATAVQVATIAPYLDKMAPPAEPEKPKRRKRKESDNGNPDA